MSDPAFVKEYSVPFETQRKHRLVYCDLAEHTILHVLITKETSFEYGYPGYEVFLKRLMEEWYLDERKPNPDWMKQCYMKSFLKPQQALELIKEMQRVLGESYFDALEDYFDERKKREEQLQQWKEQRKQRRIDERVRWIEVAKQLHHKSPRTDIVTASYFIRVEYKEVMVLTKQSTTLKEYDRKMKQYSKEEILAELLMYIESLPEIPDILE